MIGEDGGRGVVLQAVDGMERPLFVLDADFRLRYVNPAAAALFGRSAAELAGLHVWEDFPQVAGTEFQRAYLDVARTGAPRTFEAFVARTDSWWRVDVFATGAGLVVTLEDVTELTRALHARDEAVADRIAAADRAAAAAAVAERAGRHLMLLGDIGRTFGARPDLGTAVDRLARLCVPLLADWCTATVFEGGRVRHLGRAHRDPERQPVLDRLAELRLAVARPTGTLPRTLLAGRPLVQQQLGAGGVAALLGDDASREALEALAPAAMAAFPLTSNGTVTGLLVLVNGPARGPFTDEELRTAGIAARRVAEMLENARLVAAQGQMAQRLQRSLLADPVQPDHLQLAVRYRPATLGISLGGDWYDGFLRPDGETVLVIGDVMGHDVEAAAAMGQVKTLVRAIAYDRLGEPARVLERADQAVVGLGLGTLATALVACVEQDGRSRTPPRVRWSSAGHPQPLLLAADGTARDLDAPVGPPLGVGWQGARADGSTELAAGSTLLLCTDGLFERRTVGVDEGRRRVRASLEARAGLPLEELCDALLADLLGDGVEDDVALLAVRALPAGG